MRLPDLLPVAETAISPTVEQEGNANSIILLTKTDKFISDALRSNPLEDQNRKKENLKESFKSNLHSNIKSGFETSFEKEMNWNKRDISNRSYYLNFQNSMENENNYYKQQYNQDSYYDSPLSSVSVENPIIPRGIINPNYPGFEMFAHALSDYYIKNFGYGFYDSDTNYETEVCYNNNNNKNDDVKPIEIEREDTNSNIKYCNNNFIQNISEEDYLSQINQLCLWQGNNSLENHNSLCTESNIVKIIKKDNPNEHEMNDKSPFDSTPTNIVGDFRKEVELELGLYVTGYNKFSNEVQDDIIQITKFSDAKLSNATELINSKMSPQMLNKQYKNVTANKNTELQPSKDLPSNLSPATLINDHNLKLNSEKCCQLENVKYQKFSHDDRQLPPVVIEYKRCPRNSAKYEQSTFTSKSPQATKQKANRTNLKTREEFEINQYQEIVNNKESISKNSRYAQLSSWAKYLENIVKEKSTKDRSNLMTPTALELFDAYKIQNDIGIEEFKNHFQLATEIEIKRRNDREQIRKRLAMDVESKRSINQFDSNKKHNIRSHTLHKGKNQLSDLTSESDSYSSDSESCPKFLTETLGHSSMNVYNHSNIQDSEISLDVIYDQKEVQKPVPNYSKKIKKCDVFTQQSKLQVEVRTALAQSAQVAQMQIKIQKQKQGESPLTTFIRITCQKSGITMGHKRHRVSRQMLTKLNIPQLQFLFYSFNIYFEDLNEVLVKFLIERDDLQATQNVILFDIKEISRYIGTKEHI